MDFTYGPYKKISFVFIPLKPKIIVFDPYCRVISVTFL